MEFTLKLKFKLVCYKTAEILVVAYVFGIKLSCERAGHSLSLAIFLSGGRKTVLSFEIEINYTRISRTNAHEWPGL